MKKTVKIRLILADDGGVQWVVGAWDEWSVDENETGFREDVAAAREAHGAENVRLLDVAIPDDAMARAFRPHAVEGEVSDA